ncbi:MAG: hypothetical protein Q7S32_01905 [bacterium]|nr:hypothetical protein [bacterium]
MATDCEKLSPKALEIFEKIQKFYPPTPWSNPRCTPGGMVCDNRWFDLCKSEDRKSLMEGKKSSLGHMVEIQASVYIKKEGSLKRFSRRSFGLMIQNTVELLLLLNDLDFQIETMDIVES